MIVFIQYSSCQLRILAGGAHIILISGTDLLVVVGDVPVAAGLLFVVAFQGFIEKLVVHSLDALVTVVDIQMGTASVYIFRFELTTVVVEGTFSDGNADRSLHKISLPFTFRPQPGFCYSCQE